jgi:23S rRNA (adenine2503-C2)-methyltransferase
MSVNFSSFYDMTFLELQKSLEQNGFSTSAANLLYNHFYKFKRIEKCQHHNLSPKVKEFISQHYSFDLPIIKSVYESEDKTVKFLIQLTNDNSDELIETVIIPFQSKYTICLSSQVGCRMNCSFCFTGTQGLKRHLKTSEIVGQFIVAWNWLALNRPNDEAIKNIVFMGQGEPLHNFDAVKKSCQIFIDQHGTSIGLQKITVSTAGYLPGLIRWNNEMPGVNLALSLHSADSKKRQELIPIDKKYPLKEVLNYIKTIPLARKQYIIFEYLLIDQFNDSLEDAREVVNAIKDLNPIVNIIPFNPFPGSNYKRPPHERIMAFQNEISLHSIPAIVRGTKGDSILAACGQLNSEKSF